MNLRLFRGLSENLENFQRSVSGAVQQQFAAEEAEEMFAAEAEDERGEEQEIEQPLEIEPLNIEQPLEMEPAASAYTSFRSNPFLLAGAGDKVEERFYCDFEDCDFRY